MRVDASAGPAIKPKRGPRRVVALGGGTGLPAVLRGLRHLVANGEMTSLTAVVAMSDDGGSSGRLRRSQGVPPPGDVRNCLVALCPEEDLISRLFQHRYAGEEIGGHNLGNLILAALAEQTGSFLKAVEVSSRVLRTQGRILPATLEDVSLRATLDDGTLVHGESAIGACSRKIRDLTLVPSGARATPGVVDALAQADLIVLGPGSLFTSVIPNLLLGEIADAVKRSSAARVWVANLVGGQGEASGLTLDDHLEAVEEHAGGKVVDVVLAHEGVIDIPKLERYRAEGLTPLTWAGSRVRGVPIVRRNLLAPDAKLRHDSDATAAGLLAAWHHAVVSIGVGGGS